MTQRLFREYIVLFKEWPIDSAKSGRCLGEYLRKMFSTTFTKGELSENINEAKWQRILEHLKPIANNEYVSRYSRVRSTAALNLSKDQCKYVTSNQAIKIMNEL